MNSHVKRKDAQRSNPSPEAFALALEVIAGRMPMERAIDRLIEQQKRKRPKVV